jgi:hypothetical protein
MWRATCLPVSLRVLLILVNATFERNPQDCPKILYLLLEIYYSVMHSIYARINNGSAFLSSCLLALLGAIALSSLLFPSEAKGGRVAVGTIKVYASITWRNFLCSLLPVL